MTILLPSLILTLLQVNRTVAFVAHDYFQKDVNGLLSVCFDRAAVKEPGCQRVGAAAGKKPTVAGNYPNRVKIKKQPWHSLFPGYAWYFHALAIILLESIWWFFQKKKTKQI